MCNQEENVVLISLEKLRPFPDHPFQVRDDQLIQQLVDSIRDVGMLVPAIVRRTKDGFYQLIGGHRRKHACEILGLDTAVNLGIGLAMKGKRVLLIDADPQGSLTASLGYAEPDEISESLATVLTDVIEEEDFPVELGLLHHEEGVDLLPGNIELSAMEVTMGSVMSREMIMREYLEKLKRNYDYILIDCMPSLGMMTVNALVAADSVLNPVQAAYLPVKGLQQLIKTINMVRKRLNKHLRIEGILLTMVDYRSNFTKDIAATVHELYEAIGVFDVVIPSSIKSVLRSWIMSTSST